MRAKRPTIFCITSARVRVSRGAPGGVAAASASPRARLTRASRRAQYRRPPATGPQRATAHQPQRTKRAPCIVGSNWLAGGESQKDHYAESGVSTDRVSGTHAPTSTDRPLSMSVTQSFFTSVGSPSAVRISRGAPGGVPAASARPRALCRIGSVCRKNYFHFTSQAEIERGIAVQVNAALTRRDLTHILVHTRAEA